MGNLIFNFLQEQGIFVVLGLMVAGGIFSQIMAARRFRRLRAGIQSLAALQSPSASGMTSQVGAGGTSQTETGRGKQSRSAVGTAETSRAEAGGRPSLRDRFSERRSEQTPPGGQEISRDSVYMQAQGLEPEQELDSQLRYLKQSLDRIAAGRDQKLEEETREHRRLTPEQEAIIADILREYLA